MKASDNSIRSFRICIRALGEYVFDHVPKMDDLCASLVEYEIFSGKAMLLSDLFAKGFVYKPITFDTPRLSSKEEYRLFKITKNAKYIEESVLRKASSPEKLTALIKDNFAKVTDSHIHSTLTGFSSPFSRIIDSTRKDPVRTRIERNATFELYLGTPCDASVLKEKNLFICGQAFTVESVSEIENKDGTSCILLAPMKADAKKADLPAKAFRLGYNKKSASQFFLPGSVFEKFTHEDSDHPLPFSLDCSI